MTKPSFSSQSAQPANSAQPITIGDSQSVGPKMRWRKTLCFCGSCLLAGCLTQSKPPYANDPVLLHYKPETTDSETILAQQQASRRSSEPAMPFAGNDPSRPPNPALPSSSIVPVSAQQPLAPLSPNPLPTAKSEPSGPLLPPPDDPTPPARASSLLPETTSLTPPIGPNPPQASTPLPPLTLTARPAEVASAPLAPPQDQSIKEKPPFEIFTEVPPTKPAVAPAPFQTTTNPIVGTALLASAPSSVFMEAPPPIPGRAAPPAAPTPSAAPSNKHRIVAGEYGHDPEYHWIQGVLERQYRGDTCVRYADPGVEDAYGGKVRLDDDRMVAEFHEGDVIGLEGEIISASDGDRPGAPPRFLIHDVWLVRKK